MAPFSARYGAVFGEITIGGKTCDHDVVIRLSGEIVKRKKKLDFSLVFGADLATLKP